MFSLCSYRRKPRLASAISRGELRRDTPWTRPFSSLAALIVGLAIGRDRRSSWRGCARRRRPPTRSWPPPRLAADQRMVELEHLREDDGRHDRQPAGRACAAVNERLDAVSHRLGESMQATTKHTVENLAQAERAAGGDRQRAEEHHRPRLPGDVAAERALQQADARRLRPGPDGNRSSRTACRRRLRIPVHAVERQAARLRGVPARPAAAGDRRQVSARGRHGVSRRQHGRRAQVGGARGCART